MTFHVSKLLVPEVYVGVLVELGNDPIGLELSVEANYSTLLTKFFMLTLELEIDSLFLL